MKLNPRQIALREFIAFIIDITIICLPLLILLNISGVIVFLILWIFYIPTAEYIFCQTMGMKLVGTKIYASLELDKISFKVVFRRHIARISIIWGVVAWLFVFFGKPMFSDYVIVHKEYYSNDESPESASISEKITNKFPFTFIILLVGFFLFAYIKNEYVQSTTWFDKELETNIVNQYIKTSNTKKEQWNNGAIKQIFELNTNNEKHGNALVFYVDGKLKEKAIYENGLLKQVESFEKDGLLLHKIICKDETNCTQITYKPNGKIDNEIDIKYLSNKSTPIFNGKWIQYHYDKQYVTRVTNYKDGKENGLSQTFREDGKLWSEVNYIDGKREGKEIIYNRDGSIFGEVFYENDREIKK